MSKKISIVVDSLETQYDYDFGVGIFFGEGNPENGGESWNFTRSISDEDDFNEGVCTVKEIQQLVHYGGIQRFAINPASIVCEFDSITSDQIGYSVVHADISAVDVDFDNLQEIAEEVFKGTGVLEVTSLETE